MTKAKAKMKFLLGHNMKIVFSGGNQPLVGEVYWGTFADWGGGGLIKIMANEGRGGLPSSPSSENPVMKKPLKV